jgi:hypothetical protein
MKGVQDHCCRLSFDSAWAPGLRGATSGLASSLVSQGSSGQFCPLSDVSFVHLRTADRSNVHVIGILHLAHALLQRVSELGPSSSAPRERKELSVYRNFVARNSNWNLLFGGLTMFVGVAFLMWPQLALALLAGTLGINFLLLGGYLMRVGWDQRQLAEGVRVERIYPGCQSSSWVGASERERREARRARATRGMSSWGSPQIFGGWF